MEHTSFPSLRIMRLKRVVGTHRWSSLNEGSMCDTGQLGQAQSEKQTLATGPADVSIARMKSRLLYIYWNPYWMKIEQGNEGTLVPLLRQVTVMEDQASTTHIRSGFPDMVSIIPNRPKEPRVRHDYRASPSSKTLSRICGKGRHFDGNCRTIHKGCL